MVSKDFEPVIARLAAMGPGLRAIRRTAHDIERENRETAIFAEIKITQTIPMP